MKNRMLCGMDYSYRWTEKVRFYFSYLFYKVLIPLEVLNPRWKMWAYEWRYSLRKFVDYSCCLPWVGDESLIETRFGRFRVRLNTADAANVSPAFERLDVNQLLGLLEQSTRAEESVLFLDVGGDIGTYSVTVANRFGSKVDVHCFEPIPPSAELIRENLSLNGLDSFVQIHEVALSDQTESRIEICLDDAAPGSSSAFGEGTAFDVPSERLDVLLKNQWVHYDTVILKLDVEGMETQVLRGCEGLLRSGCRVELMVEDFLDHSVLDYLVQRGWEFKAKRTDYNSWWSYRERMEYE